MPRPGLLRTARCIKANPYISEGLAIVCLFVGESTALLFFASSSLVFGVNQRLALSVVSERFVLYISISATLLLDYQHLKVRIYNQ